MPRSGVLTPDDPLLRVDATLGDDPSEIAPVRTAVAALAIRAGFRDRAADAVLALDELIANAQEHGRPPITVRAVSDGRLVIVVSDHGAGFSRPAVWRTHPPHPFARRGRGLWIARQLTDCICIDTGPDGTTVRVELSPDPHIGA
jgi:serine/threonine-protein kinase RsbW